MFTKEKDQLTAMHVEDTRYIANLRIHIERDIGAVRRRNTILSATLYGVTNRLSDKENW